jgi:hypothetical protein
MIRFLFVPLLFFVSFYVLFWNVKRWKLSAWKLFGLAMLCALASSIAAGLAVAFITIVLN